jgi:Domain of unknown function (DUF4432)
MTEFHVDLINVAAGVHDCSPYSHADRKNEWPWSVRMDRLRGGLSDGVDVVRFDNGRFALDILPTRGMGIWQGVIDGVHLGWDSPVALPVHPSFVDPTRRGGIGWLDGFNELVCRCGLGWHGAPGTDVQRDDAGKVVSEQFLPLHGRIANLPAHHVRFSQSNNELLLTGIVDEGCLFGGQLRLTSRLRTNIGGSRFDIIDTVINRSGAPAEVEMLYHCNFGRPFLEDGASFHLAHFAMAPRDLCAAEGIADWTRFESPRAGFSEQVYFAQPVADDSGQALAVLANAGHDLAVGLRFDTTTLPWFALWKNTQSESDGYVTGLEPASSFPNNRQFERENGRVMTLQPQESVTFHLSIEIANVREEGKRLIQETRAMQQGRSPSVMSTPNPGWSPA